jgi:hypothetical protein
MGYCFRCQSEVDQSNCLREDIRYMETEDKPYEPIDNLTIYTQAVEHCTLSPRSTHVP